jgi:hypothetical protein
MILNDVPFPSYSAKVCHLPKLPENPQEKNVFFQKVPSGKLTILNIA